MRWYLGFLVFLTLSSHTVNSEVLWLDDLAQPDGIKMNAATFSLIAPYVTEPIRYSQLATQRALKTLEDPTLLSCRGNLKKTPERISRFPMTTAPQTVFPSIDMNSLNADAVHIIDIHATQVKQKTHVYTLKNSSRYTLGFIACTNSEQGRAFVARLDEIIADVSKQKAYFDTQMQWFSSSTIRMLYNEVYGTNFQ